jgi:plastocyanin
MKRFALLLSLFALAGFALAACGDDDEGATTATTPEPAATTPAPGGAAEATLEVSAPKDGSFAFTPNKLDAQTGPLTIEFTNPAAVSHDLIVEQDGAELGRTDLIADGGTDSVSFGSKAGSYTFYCDVPGHREGGMEGTLTVE